MKKQFFAVAALLLLTLPLLFSLISCRRDRGGDDDYDGGSVGDVGESGGDDETEAHTHKNGDAVFENMRQPGCTVDGSYDEVVYCTDCLAEISRIEHIILATGHKYEKYACLSCGEAAPLSTGLEFLRFGEGECYVASMGRCKDREVVIPLTSPEGDVVTGIANFAFSDRSDIVSVMIPDTVRTIGEYAFSGCTRLLEIDIPDGVTEIGRYTFYSCDSIKSIDIHSGITRIGDGAFSRSGITEITVPDSVTEIGERAFEACTSLVSVTLPNAVTEIPRGAFSLCNLLSDITVPSGVTAIGESAFSGCTALRSLSLPSSVGSIGAYAFSLTSVDEITVPEGVGEISDGCFKGCTELCLVSLPDSIFSIGEEAFLGCIALSRIEIPEGVSEIRGGCLSGCAELSEIVIPQSVTKIHANAFSNCFMLSRIFYRGTSDAWGYIIVDGAGNQRLLGAAVAFYSKSEPMYSGSFWHYGEEDGMPTLWRSN